jgi:hypothetical protein
VHTNTIIFDLISSPLFPLSPPIQSRDAQRTRTSPARDEHFHQQPKCRNEPEEITSLIMPVSTPLLSSTLSKKPRSSSKGAQTRQGEKRIRSKGPNPSLPGSPCGGEPRSQSEFDGRSFRIAWDREYSHFFQIPLRAVISNLASNRWGARPSKQRWFTIFRPVSYEVIPSFQPVHPPINPALHEIATEG